MHISCLSPTEKFSPFSTTGANSFKGKLPIVSFKCDLSKAVHNSSSEYLSNGSRLYLNTKTVKIHELQKGKEYNKCKRVVFPAKLTLNLSYLPYSSNEQHGILRNN